MPNVMSVYGAYAGALHPTLVDKAPGNAADVRPNLT